MTPDPPTRDERPARVAIPGELAKEVRTHPERFRPLVARYDQVLTLSGGEPRVARVLTSGAPDESGTQPWITVEGDRADDPAVEAWAPVGAAGVPDGHPVKVGDRVLALCHDGRCDVANPCTVSDGYSWADLVDYPHGAGHIVVVDAKGCVRRITRWAILPPAPDAEPPGLTIPELRQVAETASATFAAESGTGGAQLAATSAHLKARRAVEDMATAHREQLAEARAQVEMLTTEAERLREALERILGDGTVFVAGLEIAPANAFRSIAREALGPAREETT